MSEYNDMNIVMEALKDIRSSFFKRIIIWSVASLFVLAMVCVTAHNRSLFGFIINSLILTYDLVKLKECVSDYTGVNADIKMLEGMNESISRRPPTDP